MTIHTRIAMIKRKIASDELWARVALNLRRSFIAGAVITAVLQYNNVQVLLDLFSRQSSSWFAVELSVAVLILIGVLLEKRVWKK